MRKILVGGFAAYILERGRAESPSQYQTFRSIIEGVRAGGVKVSMKFDSFGHMHFRDGGPHEKGVVHLSGTWDIPQKWDITEEVVTSYGEYPSSKILEQRSMLEGDGLILGEALGLPFHQDRQVSTIIHENGRLTYHLKRGNHSIPWEQVLERIEGPPAPMPGILDHMQG